MATSITITITPTRALTVEGRLVAGETAEVTIGGATPTALYLVAPDQTIVADCEAFTPAGQGIGGVGFLQLATEQVAALFAHTPAGRMVAVWALVNNADGVAGAGWIPVVSAPMPDELVNLDIDFYLRASQVGAGLAIVDGKLVCTIPPAPVTSVNGQTGAVVLTGADILTYVYIGGVPIDNALIDLQAGKANAADLRYAQGATITASAQLEDRTGNRVVPLGTNTENIVLTFPDAVAGYLRDFLVLVTNTTGNTGNITFTPPTGATVYGDGFSHSPASGETWLYVVSEAAANVFWCKSEKMEVAS